MVTETFRLQPYILAGKFLRIVPGGIQSVLRSLSMILFVLFVLLLGHQSTTIVTYKVAVLHVCVDMLGILVLKLGWACAELLLMNQWLFG